MLKLLAKNKFQIGALLYFFALVVYWVFLWQSDLKTSNYNYLYSLLFSLTPLVGGAIGMVKAGMWGRFRSSVGKAVFFFSLGLFLWGAGSMVWSYYNFVVKDALPYPSLADLGFAPSIFFWGVGAVFLSKASGARFALKSSIWAKLFTILTVVVLPFLAYYLLIKVARQGTLVPEGESVLKVVLDIAYPLGDFIALMLSVIIFGLSFRYFGGFFKIAIISLLTGLAVMFVGDFVFSYTTTDGSFFNGNWGDLILTTGLFLMTFGVLGFASKPALAAKKPRGEG
jgi:hypothetical protein